jgi:hypothetical protein
MEYVGIFLPFVVLSIPIIAIVLGHKQKTQKNKIREMELQKEILELEVKKQGGKIKLLQEENKNLDKIIDEK